MSMMPSVLLLHVGCVAVTVAARAAGSEIDPLTADAKQPLAFSTITVCVPEPRPENVTGEVASSYEPPSIFAENGPVPPLNVAMTCPLLAPLQVMSDVEEMLTEGASFTVIVCVAVLVQLFSSDHV